MSRENQSFCEYLVKNQIIQVDDMVNAMIQQIKFTPTVSEVVFEEKLMKPDQILSVISLQSRNKSDFISAAKELGLWSQDLETNVFLYLDKIQKPLVERLIDDQLLTFDTLNQHFDSYLGSITDAQANQPEIVTEVKHQVDTSLNHSASPEILVFTEMFDEKTKQLILDGLNQGIFSNSLQLLETFQNIAATAEMASLTRMAGIFSACASKIEKYGTLIQHDDPVIQKFTLLLINAIEPLWSFRESILKNGIETVFSAENPPMNQILNLLQNFLDSEN